MNIGFIIPSGRSLTAEEVAAWEFLVSRKRTASKRLRSDRLPSAEDLRRSFDVLWWHSDIEPDETLALPVRSRSVLKQFVERDGSLFLSLLPSALPVSLNFERTSPQITVHGTWEEESWTKDYPDIRGHATYRGHPIFRGMTGGAYTWMPEKGMRFSSCIYDNSLPSSGKVIAVERQYIKVVPRRRTAWEYAIRKGKILCVGTYLFFTENHPRVRQQVDLFASNCLTYLGTSRRRAGRAHYWTFNSAPPSRVERHSASLSVRGHVGDPPTIRPSIERELESGSSGEAFDVGGRRCVILGNERTGIREVWFHPIRGLQSLHVGLQTGGGPVRWLHEAHLRIEVRPDAVIRRTAIGTTEYTDITFSHPTSPSGALAIKTSGGPAKLYVTAEVDLRMMWPLDDQATGPLTFTWDEGLQGAVVSVSTGELASVIGCSLPPRQTYAGNCQTLRVTNEGEFHSEGHSDRIVHIGLMVPLGGGSQAVTLAFAGSGTSEREAELAYREMIDDPSYVLTRLSTSVDGLQASKTMLHVSDEHFMSAYGFALAGTDRFFLTTPDVGTSYVAGFGTSERGWDGGQQVSGRPGYAWYFGRDAVWTAFSALAIGDFEKVRRALEFLGRHQDVSGMILHELTTSGFAHYDAADSTPLYLILMGRYVRATGHRSFARSEFARIRKALDFCFSTDTDGDGLIENTNVGHGWIEGGGLFPVHTEHYLASCWSAALLEVSFLADVVGHPQLSKRWALAAENVHRTVEDDFWDDEKGYYAFAKNADGSYNREQTVMPAVGLYLGIGHGKKAEQTLRPFAGNRFTSDWGVRIIGTDNPMYKPTGYHYGSVWPLFTGWVALAEFRHNRPLQGFMHVLSTAMTYVYQAAGCVEEAFHGEVFEPAGVCHRQAWSESMVLQPLTEGMLGIEANGFDHTLRLSPWIPPHWPSFRATRIRVGRSWISISLERGEHSTTAEFTLEGREPVHVHIALRFPLGTHIETIDNGSVERRIDRFIRTYADAPSVDVDVSSASRITYTHRGGVAVVPPNPVYVPGGSSSGLRITDERFQNNTYIVTCEGKGSRSYELEVIHRGKKTLACEGCDLLETIADRSKIRVTFPRSGEYTTKRLIFTTQ